jgi:hypothetical protein
MPVPVAPRLLGAGTNVGILLSNREHEPDSLRRDRTGPLTDPIPVNGHMGTTRALRTTGQSSFLLTLWAGG